MALYFFDWIILLVGILLTYKHKLKTKEQQLLGPTTYERYTKQVLSWRTTLINLWSARGGFLFCCYFDWIIMALGILLIYKHKIEKPRSANSLAQLLYKVVFVQELLFLRRTPPMLSSARGSFSLSFFLAEYASCITYSKCSEKYR